MPGRKPIPVVKADLENTIKNLEARSTYASRSALWAAVAADDWARSIGLSAQVAMLKAKAFGIEPKTPVGKKGRAKGEAPVNRGPRKSKRIELPIVEILHKKFGDSLAKTVNRAAKGSLKAAVKLLCIDCCAGQKGEVALCTIVSCPLWSFRPYKHKLSLTPEGRKSIVSGEFEKCAGENAQEEPSTQAV